MEKNIEKRLLKIHQKIEQFAHKYGRKAESITLLAASKQQSIADIDEAFRVGQKIFGENYLQEALPKIEQLPKEIEWHFIGPLQRNKTRKIAEHFNWVQSIENAMIATRLNEQRPPHLPPLNICIEVNISAEASKSGLSPSELPLLLEHCMKLPRLKLRGLMSIPKANTIFEEQRREFRKLKILWDVMREKGFMLDTLSMGMSNDFEAAIAEGATLVRIGTLIFGERK